MYQNPDFFINLIDRANTFLTTSKKLIPLYNNIKPFIGSIKKIKKYLSEKDFSSFFKLNNNLESKKEDNKPTKKDDENSSSSSIKFFL